MLNTRFATRVSNYVQCDISACYDLSPKTICHLEEKTRSERFARYTICYPFAKSTLFFNSLPDLGGCGGCGGGGGGSDTIRVTHKYL